MLKIIYDPILKQKWVTLENNIKPNEYTNAIRWNILFYYNAKDKKSTRILIDLFTGNEHLKRMSRDVVRCPTLKEYLMIERLLTIQGFQYNRKKNQLISCSE